MRHIFRQKVRHCYILASWNYFNITMWISYNFEWSQWWIIMDILILILHVCCMKYCNFNFSFAADIGLRCEILSSLSSAACVPSFLYCFCYSCSSWSLHYLECSSSAESKYRWSIAYVLSDVVRYFMWLLTCYQML